VSGKDPREEVVGLVFAITFGEPHSADEYEMDAYKHVRVKLFWDGGMLIC